MKIIYITTSLEENDYNEFNKLWTVSLNPSNQNFHNKMIRALAINNKVEVISIRPFSRKYCKTKWLKAKTRDLGNITYHYVRIWNSWLSKLSSLMIQPKRILDNIDLNDSLIIADTINPKCAYVANYLKKKFNLPVIGICTDSPSNITGTGRSYTMYLLKQCAKFDGFVTLTEGLNLLYNKTNKEHITIEGIVEDEVKPDFKVEGKYIFFGGALLERYGIYNLIEAFKMVEDNSLSLLICGHHEEEKFKEAISGDPRIKYLGTLPVKDVLAYEASALININPRPFTQDLDRLSIPSKNLEYFASGKLTITVRNTELEKSFKNSAIWAKTGEVKDLYKAIETALNMSKEERENKAELAKNTAISLYSIKKVGETLTNFLSTFIK